MKNTKLLTIIPLIFIIFFIVIYGGNSNEEVKDLDSNVGNSAQDENALDSMLKKMSLEEKVGQLLMPDFRKWNGQKVTKANDEIASLIREYNIGGVILFRENFVNRTQSKQLIQDFQGEASIPLMMAVDQEGGLVTRVSFAPRFPGNMALGATGDTELSKQVGLAIGSELRGLGIHINFGPVLDINNNPDNPVIGTRSFGDNAELVTKMGLAYMEGLNEAGVAAVGKHFPGHGDVDADSHLVLPKSDKTLDQLRSLELKPYQSLISEGLQGIMTAHITFNQIDSRTQISKKDGRSIGIPATLSSSLMTDLLRTEMGYDGVLFSDAMNMNAIANHYGPVEAAILAIEAGVDVILMPINIEEVYNGLIDAVESGRIDESRIDESVRRILQLKLSYVFDNNGQVEYKQMKVAEAREVEQTVANKSVTVVFNDGILPLKAENKEDIVLVSANSSLSRRLIENIDPYVNSINTIRLDKFSNLSGALAVNQKKVINEASKIIVITDTASKADRDINGWKMKTFQSIIDQGIPTIIVASRNPYDYASLSGFNAYITQYDSGSPSFKATSNIIFGKSEATGNLPVKLSKE